ncbi:MAG: hypothetical protein ACPHY8_04205 [Patescibacteria group bacterium]
MINNPDILLSRKEQLLDEVKKEVEQKYLNEIKEVNTEAQNYLNKRKEEVVSQYIVPEE